MRHASEELLEEGKQLLSGIEVKDKERLTNTSTRCVDKWIENKQYSPDKAEKFRAAAREKLYTSNVEGKI
jgi:hypothetical protein